MGGVGFSGLSISSLRLSGLTIIFSGLPRFLRVITSDICCEQQCTFLEIATCLALSRMFSALGLGIRVTGLGFGDGGPLSLKA